MPHVLIHKLDRLMDMRFPSQRKVGDDPFLTPYRSDLPIAVLDAVEDIVATARTLFGPRIEPSIQQASIMKSKGYIVRPGRVMLSVWQSGIIETPKGLIQYP